MYHYLIINLLSIFLFTSPFVHDCPTTNDCIEHDLVIRCIETIQPNPTEVHSLLRDNTTNQIFTSQMTLVGAGEDFLYYQKVWKTLNKTHNYQVSVFSKTINSDWSGQVTPPNIFSSEYVYDCQPNKIYLPMISR